MIKLIKVAVEECPICGCDMDLYQGEIGQVLMCCACEYIMQSLSDCNSQNCQCAHIKE